MAFRRVWPICPSTHSPCYNISMSGKVMIVGTGNVGASIGFALVNQRTAVDELILTDINAGDAEGEAMDLSDAIAVAPEYLPVRAGTYADAGDRDVVVITAGVPQKPDGETRMQLLQRNAAVLKTIVEPIMASGFSGIFLVVSNPVDIMSYLTWRYSGLPAEQVIGSGLVLDSARLRLRPDEVARAVGTPRSFRKRRSDSTPGLRGTPSRSTRAWVQAEHSCIK